MRDNINDLSPRHLAVSVAQCVTPDLGAVSLSPLFGVEVTHK